MREFTEIRITNIVETNQKGLLRDLLGIQVIYFEACESKTLRTVIGGIPEIQGDVLKLSTQMYYENFGSQLSSQMNTGTKVYFYRVIQEKVKS